MTTTEEEALIKKEIVYPGSKYIPLDDGTKVSYFSSSLILF